MLAHTCNNSTQELEAYGLECQVHLSLHSEFQTSLSYVKPSKNQRESNEVKKAVLCSLAKYVQSDVFYINFLKELTDPSILELQAPKLACISVTVHLGHQAQSERSSPNMQGHQGGQGSYSHGIFW